MREEGGQGLGEGAEVAGLDPEGAGIRGGANLIEVHDEAFAAGDEGAEASDLADGVVEVAGEGDEVPGVDGYSLALGDGEGLDGAVGVEEDGARLVLCGGVEEEGALAA